MKEHIMKLGSLKHCLLFGVSLALAGCAVSSQIEDDLRYCDRQVHHTLTQLAGDSGTIDYCMMPRNILSGENRWNLRKADKAEWCSGFFPGILWYDYALTGDTAMEKTARLFTESLSFMATGPVYDHDLGFIVLTSYLNGYKLTGDAAYKAFLLQCADSLATLFNSRAGTMLSWPRHVGDYGGHNTIMDNLINLELLLWAAENGGDARLRDLAVCHADTTMKYQFSDRYVNRHVAVFDTIDGHFLYTCTHQGYSDTSMWARGQAWAIYGYTMIYRYTREERFLDYACHVADAYIGRLPADAIPFWDFDDPRIATSGDSLTPDLQTAPRDASAACITASALTELSDYVSPSEAAKYRKVVKTTLNTLRNNEWRGGDRCPAFLLHSTGHHPAGSEIDASISYADYYYLETLMRNR